MPNNRYIVGEREFISKAEYEAALRDLKKVEKLKNQIDFSDEEKILDFYRQMQSKTLYFESVIGRDFDDEIYELVSQIKRGEYKYKQGGKAAKKNNNKNTKVKKTKTIKGPKKKKTQEKIVVLTQREEKMRRLVSTILFMVAIGCFVCFGVYYFRVYEKNKEASEIAAVKNNEWLNNRVEDYVVVNRDEEKTFTVLDQYKNLYNNNKDLIGWLKIDDTLIDYPVVQTVDNEFYLDKNLSKQSDRNGTLFLDKDCSITKPSTNYIIYGHHMKSGQMFGDLDNYKRESFYKKHKLIQFDTIYEEGLYEVMYVFNAKVYYEDEVVFKYYQFIDANSELEFQSNMEEMEKISLYKTGVSAVYGDQLLTLSTCDYIQDDARFVVVAKRIFNE